MSHFGVAGLAILAMTASAGIAQSANLITNGSFEDGTNAPTTFFATLPSGNTDIAGWKVSGGSIDWIGDYWQAADQRRSIDLSGNEPGGLAVSQSLTLGQGAYSLTFSLSGNPDGDPSQKQVLVALDNVPGSPFSKFYNTATQGTTRANMNYLTQTIAFSLGQTTTVGISFSNPLGGPYGPVIDNVSLNVVPIPGAALLFGSALAGIGLLRRRRSSPDCAIA